MTKHGTYGGYNHGCHCPDCREAHRLRFVQMRKTKDPYTHGRSGYNNYGCRCPVCRAAKSIENASYKRNRNAKMKTEAQ